MKKAVFAAVVVVGILIIQGLARSTYDIWKKQDLLKNAAEELQAQEEENRKLKAQLTIVQDPQFLENEARNRLLLNPQGQQGVIIPQELLEKKEPPQRDSRPNWEKWLDLVW